MANDFEKVWQRAHKEPRVKKITGKTRTDVGADELLQGLVASAKKKVPPDVVATLRKHVGGKAMKVRGRK